MKIYNCNFTNIPFQYLVKKEFPFFNQKVQTLYDWINWFTPDWDIINSTDNWRILYNMKTDLTEIPEDRFSNTVTNPYHSIGNFLFFGYNEEYNFDIFDVTDLEQLQGFYNDSNLGRKGILVYRGEEKIISLSPSSYKISKYCCLYGTLLENYRIFQYVIDGPSTTTYYTIEEFKGTIENEGEYIEWWEPVDGITPKNCGFFEIGFCCICNWQRENCSEEGREKQYHLNNYFTWPLGNGSFYDFSVTEKLIATYVRNDYEVYANATLFNIFECYPRYYLVNKQFPLSHIYKEYNSYQIKTGTSLWLNDNAIIPFTFTDTETNGQHFQEEIIFDSTFSFNYDSIDNVKVSTLGFDIKRRNLIPNLKIDVF